MGNQPSTCPTEEGIHVEHQNRFFAEYQQMTLADPEIAKADMERWDSVKDTILDLPLEEQAEYCDYVMTKLYEMEDKAVIKSSGEAQMKIMAWIIDTKHQVDSVAGIGGLAKCILAQDDEDLRAEMIDTFQELLEVQRELRDNPSLRQQLEALDTDTNDTDKLGMQMGSLMGNMMKAINTQIEEGANVEEVGQNLLGQIMGQDDARDIMQKARATIFINQQLAQGVTLPEALKLTRERFDLPAGTELEVKLKVTITLDEEDDAQSIDDSEEEASEAEIAPEH